MKDEADLGLDIVERTGELFQKESAEYKKGVPFHRCGICIYYHDHKCRVVAGWIEPYMGCKFFEARKDGMDKDSSK